MKANLGIAFVTGRTQFKDVLNTYFLNWLEHDLLENDNVNLHLFVVYDVTYQDVSREQFRPLAPEIEAKLASVNFYGRGEIAAEKNRLVRENLLDADEADLLFGEGYAKKRNAAMHFALQNNMDRLLFLDDDEYPVAVTRATNGRLSWTGQSIVGTHLRYASNADITNGLHCGYISPIPRVEFDRHLTEGNFKSFIEAISNDIISWESVKRTIIDNGGITYADSNLVANPEVSIVRERDRRKFISGANLCIRLDRSRTLPVFYNPPGARGEDAFMSTMLTDLTVARVPCYTFHDAFGQYQHVLSGVLPHKLKAANPRAPKTVSRFVKAAVGWVRYKPLLTYITHRADYDLIMNEALYKLDATVPNLCSHFNTPRFKAISAEFREYHSLVRDHFAEFEATTDAWAKLTRTHSPVRATAVRV